ncbi:CoA transferase [Desulfococcaceae bacterium OttesenSCG-928-F15]|nr:CoA transferase [Desulfococcaceae bacterium OttesenSCG-928-F15]
MEGAFAGIKVLDLSRLLPGPFCSMLLADFGADVIKVEEPVSGDYIRWWPPLVGKNSGIHVVLNRGKRSLTLNLKSPAGKEVFMKLARDADVVLESFRPGVMDRLGLGYAELQRINPRLIYCNINGYGATGPLAMKAGHDINYLALTGVLSYCGRENLPTIPGVQVADIGGGGLYAAFSITAALLARERLGMGQYIDISMSDGACSWNCMRWGKFLGDGIEPGWGDDFLNHGYACYNIYETMDQRHISVGALEPQFWEILVETLGQPEWKKMNYFEPGEHQKKLKEEIAKIFKGKTLAEWMTIFADKDCCVEPVLNMGTAMNTELLKQRQMVVEMRHASWGAYRQLGIAPKMSLTPGKIRGHAPELGEHTASILNELGIDALAQEKLREEGVV